MKKEEIKHDIENILNFYPEQVRPILKHQIINTIEFINEQQHYYLNNEDVKIVLDTLLSEVIQGRFLIHKG